MLEWEGEGKAPVPLLKELFASERRKAKVLNFSIAYGKTAHGLSKDWKVSIDEAKNTVEKWYADRPEVFAIQLPKTPQMFAFVCWLLFTSVFGVSPAAYLPVFDILLPKLFPVLAG